MKVDNLLPFAIVAVTLVASAEPREKIRPISETEIAWNWLASIAQGEMDENHLKSHGMIDADDSKLKAFALKAQAADDKWWKAENAKLCKQRAKYETDLEGLAQWYERIVADKEKNQQKILDKLPEEIGPAEALSFKSAVADHKAESVGESGGMDIPGMLRDGTITAAQELDNLCVVPQTVTELKAE